MRYRYAIFSLFFLIYDAPKSTSPSGFGLPHVVLGTHRFVAAPRTWTRPPTHAASIGRSGSTH